jgi:hypothetical protein
MKVEDLKQGYTAFGGKGDVWSDTAHIYKSLTGNLCGTPALSSNWVRITSHPTVGCKECLEAYNKEDS